MLHIIRKRQAHSVSRIRFSFKPKPFFMNCCVNFQFESVVIHRAHHTQAYSTRASSFIDEVVDDILLPMLPLLSENLPSLCCCQKICHYTFEKYNLKRQTSGEHTLGKHTFGKYTFKNSITNNNNARSTTDPGYCLFDLSYLSS